MSYYAPKFPKILGWSISSREDTNYTYALTDRNLKYLAQMIGVILHEHPDEVMKKINEARSDAELSAHVISMTKRSDFRWISDERSEFGRRLGWYAVARLLRPSVIVETGVDRGHGAVLLCAALLKNAEEGFPGQYYGTDINPSAGFLLADRYKTVGEIIYGDSKQSLLSFDKKIDLFINDSDHSAEYEHDEYEIIRPKLSEHSIIIGDNCHVTDCLLRFSENYERKFLCFHEEPLDHWYPGAGIGLSWRSAVAGR